MTSLLGFNISSGYMRTKWVFLISAHRDAFMKNSAVHREDANMSLHLEHGAKSRSSLV